MFSADTIAYANELVWEYHFDATGARTVSRREPPPRYSHHCFVVARSAKQFFQHARFDAGQNVTDEADYRRLVRRVISLSARKNSTEQEKIVIPGYANLREFSQAHEKLLQAECGGAYQSYFQRGHWRMLLPFSREHQRKMAEQLAGSLKQKRPPVVHIVRFPKLSINHAILLFDATETDTEIEFAAYDPNHPDKPARLIFDRATNTFRFPRNNYFIGGRVDVYEIYSAWNY